MAKIKNFLSRIQLIRRPSLIHVKILIAIVLIICTVTLVALRMSTLNLRQENEALHDQAAALTATNDELKEDIEQIGSAEGAVEFAQDELGYIDPDTIIYEPETASEP